METVQQVEKTFTQAELDKIVSERLTRDRAKYADYEELKVKAEKFDKMDEANKANFRKPSKERTRSKAN